eukprot:7412515-Heterocapsa_arctica.AAC.1
MQDAFCGHHVLHGRLLHRSRELLCRVGDIRPIADHPDELADDRAEQGLFFSVENVLDVRAVSLLRKG